MLDAQSERETDERKLGGAGGSTTDGADVYITFYQHAQRPLAGSPRTRGVCLISHSCRGGWGRVEQLLLFENRSSNELLIKYTRR